LYAVGAYLTFTFISEFSNFYISILLAAVAVGLIGALIEFLVIRPLYGRDELHQLLVTFGVTLIIDSVLVNAYGSTPKSVPTPEQFQSAIEFGEIIYPEYRLVVAVVAGLLPLIVWSLLEYTNYGIRIRATVHDQEIVDALGTDTKKLMTLAFAGGALLAGLAGGFAAPIFTVFPTMGTEILVITFIVVVVGGLGSFKGAAVASILIGEVSVLGRVLYPDFAGVFAYLVMIAILLIRPRGLFGEVGVG
jgi:branched-chain amino acid transport system permease protein